jgi:hypothetical protein
MQHLQRACRGLVGYFKLGITVLFFLGSYDKEIVGRAEPPMGPLGEFVNLAKYPIDNGNGEGWGMGEGRPPDRAATESSCNRQCPNLDLHGFRLTPRRGFLRPDARRQARLVHIRLGTAGRRILLERQSQRLPGGGGRGRWRGAMMDHPPPSPSPSPSRRRHRRRRRRRRPRRRPSRRPRIITPAACACTRPSSSSTPRISPCTRREWLELHEPRRVRGFRRLRPRG